MKEITAKCAVDLLVEAVNAPEEPKLTAKEIKEFINTVHDLRPQAEWKKIQYIDSAFGSEKLHKFAMHHIRLRGRDWAIEKWENPDRNEFGMTCSTAHHSIDLVFSSEEERWAAAENMFPEKPLVLMLGNHDSLLAHRANENNDVHQEKLAKQKRKELEEAKKAQRKIQEKIVTKQQIVAIGVGILAAGAAAIVGLKEWRKRRT